MGTSKTNFVVVVACVASIQWLAVVVVASIKRCVMASCRLLCACGSSTGVVDHAASFPQCPPARDLEADEIDTVRSTQDPVESEHESAPSDDHIETIIIPTQIVSISTSPMTLLQSEAEANTRTPSTTRQARPGGDEDIRDDSDAPEDPTEAVSIAAAESQSAGISSREEQEHNESDGHLGSTESNGDVTAAATPERRTESDATDECANSSSNENNDEEEDKLSNIASLSSACLGMVDDSEDDEVEADLELGSLTDSSSTSLLDFDDEGDDDEYDDEVFVFHRIGDLDEIMERLLQLSQEREDDWLELLLHHV